MGNWVAMDRTTVRIAGYTVERGPLLRGALVSTVTVLALGVGLGTLVQEDSDFSIVVTALITLGFIAGGVVAGVLSSQSHIVHGMYTAIPVAVLAVVIQIIRRLTSSGGEPWLSVVFIIFMATSLGTLGGVIGGRFSPSRRSLLER